MSLNQSRADKNDFQYRKSGGGNRSTSSGQQRPFSGGGGGKGAVCGGAATTAPPLSGQTPSLCTNRSFKKANNGQGGHPRPSVSSANIPESKTGAIPHTVQNGTLSQPTLHGASSDDHSPAPAVAVKQTDVSTQKGNQPAPRAPSYQASPVTSNFTSPTTPIKGDPQRYPLQFGSISPGFVNGIQIPARTSSAPPNLDEQKTNQARPDSFRGVSANAIPSAPKPTLSKKDVPSGDQTTVVVKADSKAKKESKVMSVPPVNQSQKPSVPSTTGILMPMHFHPASTMQFGGPSPQIPPQSLQGTSLPMPMPMALQMGNTPQVQQPIYVPGLQHPLMQPQGIIHQGQNLGFNPQMGTQLPHQLGNLGMNMSPPFNQQAGKFISTRKAVKITHPETHEELRLDKRADVYADSGSLAPRPHLSLSQQSQAVPTYPTTHPIGYYTNSYNGGPPFFPSANSLPLTSTQLTSGSQAPRYNYPVSQAPPNLSFMNASAANSFSTNKSVNAAHGTGEPASSDHVRDLQGLVSSQTSTPVTLKPAGSAGERVTGLVANEKDDSAKVLRLPGSSHVRKDSEMSREDSSMQSKPKKLSASVDMSSTTHGALSSINDSAPGKLASALSNVCEKKAEAPLKSESFLETQMPGNEGHSQRSHQVDEEFYSSSPHQAVDGSDPSKIEHSQTAEAEKTHSLSGVGDGESSSEKAAASDVSGSSADPFLVTVNCNSSEVVGSWAAANSVSSDSMSSQGGPAGETGSFVEETADEILARVKLDYNDSKNVPLQGSVKTAEVVGKTGKDAERREPGGVETHDYVVQLTTHSEVDKRVDASRSDQLLSDVADGGNTSTAHASLNTIDSMYVKEGAAKSGTSDSETDPVPANTAKLNMRHEVEVIESARPASSSSHVSTSSRASIEPSRAKNTISRGKKKRKEILQKADAAGTNLDLYMAYKGPEETEEASVPVETMERISSDTGRDEAAMSQKHESSKGELDDWEDAADISTPKAVMHKKYTRDFLLTFSEQNTDLPEGFDITHNADILIHPNVNVSRVSDREYPSTGRVVDRQTGGPRSDRRGSGMMDTDRWSKIPGSSPSAHDILPDLGYGGNMMGFRPGQGINYGVLRNPRAHAPIQYAGGILSGPMQSMGSQGGMQRNNNSDSDRWQRGTNFQKGLMPSLQTPLQVMHRAPKKYEVGKVTDEEQAKQRRLKAILNKLTPQNFEKLFEQVKEVNIDNVITLAGVISQIFDKALMEPTFCEMYANFCYHLASELPDLSVNEEKITFKRLLLNKCQEEFERGEREEEEANKADGEGESKQTDEEREEKRLKARRRMLGNIRLIGELYKKRMLTERIMHDCIKKLLGQHQNPDEEDIEALCKLMSTIGEMIDHPMAKEHMDGYFDIMAKLSKNMNLSSRVRFMLKDAIDLRKNKWQQRRKVEGPKKIEEVHRDAAQERQAQTSRLSRGPIMNSSMRRGQPVDFNPRGSSVLPSPVGQVSGFRGSPSQVRGYNAHDPRSEERNVPENRTLSVPLLHRSFGDNSITLGPQGGLARGMSIRGHPSVSGMHAADISSGLGDSRTTGALNGSTFVPERASFNSREELLLRYPQERFGGPNAFDQSSKPDLNSGHTNRVQKDPDCIQGTSLPSSASLRSQAVPPVQNASSEKMLPEERLRDKSIVAIKEFYSVQDEKEVALWMRELNAPNLYPSTISSWVTDSFERKHMERDLLAKLLVNLAKPGDGMFTAAQLIEGFESVLANLEDTVNDAPKAAEFLGQLFGKIIVEKIVPLGEVGRLIYEGGEEPGRLREVGLAGDVLGSILEMIKSDRGESTLNDILVSSNLQLEDFRPPDPRKSKKLELFV
ncbi:hypothetical protein Dimus_024452 [Dionaea muscipula]